MLSAWMRRSDLTAATCHSAQNTLAVNAIWFEEALCPGTVHRLTQGILGANCGGTAGHYGSDVTEAGGSAVRDLPVAIALPSDEEVRSDDMVSCFFRISAMLPHSWFARLQRGTAAAPRRRG